VRRATRRQNTRAILDSYIGLFKLQVFQQTSTFTQEAVAGALELARLVNHPQLYARLYQALAYAYIFWGDYAKAIDRGHQAYGYWIDNDNAEEAGLCAYVIAIAYRWSGQYDHALTWLETAASYFSAVDYQRQHVLIANEMGTLYMLGMNFVAAEQWYHIALAEALKLDDAYTAALVQQCLGAAQAYLDKYKPAEEMLQEAISYWSAQEDHRNLASAHHTLAFLYGLMRENEQAFAQLDLAVQMIANIPDNDFKNIMVEHIHQLRQTIDSGRDVHALKPR
jgi:tetratricopeptide (TPR) repeat protein